MHPEKPCGPTVYLIWPWSNIKVFYIRICSCTFNQYKFFSSQVFSKIMEIRMSPHNFCQERKPFYMKLFFSFLIITNITRLMIIFKKLLPDAFK